MPTAIEKSSNCPAIFNEKYDGLPSREKTRSINQKKQETSLVTYKAYFGESFGEDAKAKGFLFVEGFSAVDANSMSAAVQYHNKMNSDGGGAGDLLAWLNQEPRKYLGVGDAIKAAGGPDKQWQPYQRKWAARWQLKTKEEVKGEEYFLILKNEITETQNQTTKNIPRVRLTLTK